MASDGTKSMQADAPSKAIPWKYGLIWRLSSAEDEASMQESKPLNIMMPYSPLLMQLDVESVTAVIALL